MDNYKKTEQANRTDNMKRIKNPVDHVNPVNPVKKRQRAEMIPEYKNRHITTVQTKNT